MNALPNPPIQVSVLIPAYNCEATLDRAIRSVLQQTFQSYELIIVDDGSQDATLAKARTYTDNRIRILQHPHNMGEAETRNTLVRSAAGQLLAFLDADDEWLPGKLEKQLEALEGCQDGIIANVCGYFLQDEFNIQREEIPPEPASWYKHLLMGCGLGPGTTLMVSRLAFEKIGWYDPSLPRYTDWDWLLRYTRQFPLTVTREPLAFIYRGSQPRASVVESAARQFLEKHAQEFRSFGCYGRRAIGKRFLEVAIYHFQQGNRQAGWTWFRKALSKSVFQRPGMVLRILDIMLGTSIVSSLLRFRNRRLKKSG